MKTLIAVLSCILPASLAQGAMIYINSDQVTVGASTGSAGQFRYVMQHANYDQNIFNGVGTLNSGNILTADHGKVSELTGRTFSFTIENRPGEGLLFTLSAPATDGMSAIERTLAWGSFADGTKSSSDIGGVKPGAPFNAITLTAAANRSGASMTFEKFSFSSPEGDVSIADGEFTSSTAAFPTGGKYTGHASQQLAATSDLSLVPWTLTGAVTGIRDANASGSSAVWFNVSLLNAEVVVTEADKGGGGGGGTGGVVPEPTALAVLMPAAALLSRRRRI